MAKYTARLKGRFYDIMNSLHMDIMDSSSSVSYEEHEDFKSEGMMCSVSVYERYSFFGGNRCSLTLTLFGKDGDVNLTAIASGGSQAMFFKINTVGEEAFLNVLIKAVEKLEKFDGR